MRKSRFTRLVELSRSVKGYDLIFAVHQVAIHKQNGKPEKWFTYRKNDDGTLIVGQASRRKFDDVLVAPTSDPNIGIDIDASYSKVEVMEAAWSRDTFYLDYLSLLPVIQAVDAFADRLLEYCTDLDTHLVREWPQSVKTCVLCRKIVADYDSMNGHPYCTNHGTNPPTMIQQVKPAPQ